MLLNVVQINSALFTHNPKAKTLVAELSDIQVKGFQPLYDDAADVGFAIRNPKTGNVTRWAVSNEIRDNVENELLGFKLVPTPESVRAQPVMQGYTMTLLND
jgi:hypothetical protein